MSINIKARTNHGQYISFEIQPNDTITTLNATLHKLVNIPHDSQKVILKGKILPSSGTITDSGLRDGDSVIVLSRRSKPEPPALDTTPEPDAAAIRKAIAKSKGVEEKDIEDEEEPEYKSQLQDLVNSLFGNFTFNQPAAAPLPASVNPSAESIAQLTDMGFTEAQARRALVLNRLSVEQATNWLLEHGDEVPPEQPAAPAPAAASAAGEMIGGGGQVPIPIVGRVQMAETDGLTVEQRLLEMGFPSEEVTRALRATGNNYEAAMAMLLGENDEDENAFDEDSPIVRAIFSNPIVGAGLSNPRVMQAFRAMVENPASVANYIADPEVGPLILQVHAILQNLPSDGGNAEGEPNEEESP